MAHDPDAPMGWPAGHFYSPIPSLREVNKHEDRIFGLPHTLPGIELNEARHRELLRTFAPLCAGDPVPQKQLKGRRFYYENDFFCAGEALVYQSILRHVKPNRIVEVGSGYTTALLLDTVDRHFDTPLECVSIEPFPDTLQHLLWREDWNRIQLLRSPLQDVELSVFERLESNDILFIDSTHVSKTGSDVNYLFFEILPRLKSGVYLHFHDIYYPFEYPRKWVYEGRAWNEAYLLRAFLQFNAAFQIEFFNSFVGHILTDTIPAEMELFQRNPGSSIWIRKC